MKSKKSFFSLGIIVLVLFLGVGYAVVSSVYLNIGGTASVANADLKVEITDVVATTSVSGKDLDFTNELSNKNLTSNFTLNGMELNEKVTITYTVTNNETDVDAEIKLASGVELTNSNADFFDVDYEITDAETDLENNDKTMTVEVTVELIQTPVTDDEGTTTVGLKLAAIPKGGSESTSGGSSSDTLPIVFGKKYYVVTHMGYDIKSSGSWVSFNEDGTAEEYYFGDIENVSDVDYSSFKIMSSNIQENDGIAVSQDGNYVSLFDNSSVLMSYVLETEFNNIKDIPLRFGEKYVCTTDIEGGEESLIVGNIIIMHPNGSAEGIDADGTKSYAPSGTFTYTQDEIFSNENSENMKLLISENGTTITQMYEDKVQFIYTLESELPISWNTVAVSKNKSFTIDNSIISDLPTTNPKFVKVSDELMPLYLYDTAINLEGKSEALSFVSMTIEDYAFMVKYSNGIDNFYLIMVDAIGSSFGVEFAEKGLYAYDYSGENQDIDLDITLDFAS